jgi:DNA mismatch endonuclease (patch repair protein)
MAALPEDVTNMLRNTELQRSELMARIKRAHTKPEMLLRKALFARKLRYRLHSGALPGRPDIVFKGRHAVIFVNGCFWHGHNCDQFRWPKSNAEFWQRKINGNKKRDARNIRLLLADDWRVLTVWECAFRGKDSRSIEAIADYCIAWLQSRRRNSNLMGVRSRGPRL